MRVRERLYVYMHKRECTCVSQSFCDDSHNIIMMYTQMDFRAYEAEFDVQQTIEAGSTQPQKVLKQSNDNII